MCPPNSVLIEVVLELVTSQSEVCLELISTDRLASYMYKCTGTHHKGHLSNEDIAYCLSLVLYLSVSAGHHFIHYPTATRPGMALTLSHHMGMELI